MLSTIFGPSTQPEKRSGSQLSAELWSTAAVCCSVCVPRLCVGALELESRPALIGCSSESEFPRCAISGGSCELRWLLTHFGACSATVVLAFLTVLDDAPGHKSQDFVVDNAGFLPTAYLRVHAQPSSSRVPLRLSIIRGLPTGGGGRDRTRDCLTKPLSLKPSALTTRPTHHPQVRTSFCIIALNWSMHALVLCLMPTLSGISRS